MLGAAKRHKVLELWEVQRCGSDSYGDRDYVSIYGMAPAEWHAKGVRVLGRTAVECTRDRLADAIGRDVAAVAANAPPTAHTTPIRAIVDVLFRRFRENYLLCAVQVHETVLPASMTDLRARFDWSTQRLYGLNSPRENHGLLLGTKRWTPKVEA